MCVFQLKANPTLILFSNSSASFELYSMNAKRARGNNCCGARFMIVYWHIYNRNIIGCCLYPDDYLFRHGLKFQIGFKY